MKLLFLLALLIISNQVLAFQLALFKSTPTTDGILVSEDQSETGDASSIYGKVDQEHQSNDDFLNNSIIRALGATDSQDGSSSANDDEEVPSAQGGYITVGSGNANQGETEVSSIKKNTEGEVDWKKEWRPSLEPHH